MDLCSDLNIIQMRPERERGKNNRRKEVARSSTLHMYPTLSSDPGMRTCSGPLLVMTSTTSIPPAYNRLVISHGYCMRLRRQQARTFLYLLSGDRELNTLAGLDLGLDEGSDSVNGEQHEGGEDKTKKEIEAVVGQLCTDSLDAHVGDGRRVLDAGERVLVATTDLTPLAGRADDGVLGASSKSV